MHGCRSALATTALALALAGPTASSLAAGAGPAAEGAAPASASRIESALVAEMNRARAERGRRPLRSIATLARPARDQSRYLIGLGTLDHDGPDGSPFWTRLVAAGFPGDRTLAENLAMVPGCGVAAAAQTVRIWLDSPGHRANLLSPRFRWVGAGAASDTDCSETIITADYGS